MDSSLEIELNSGPGSALVPGAVLQMAYTDATRADVARSFARICRVENFKYQARFLNRIIIGRHNQALLPEGRPLHVYVIPSPESTRLQSSCNSKPALNRPAYSPAVGRHLTRFVLRPRKTS